MRKYIVERSNFRILTFCNQQHLFDEFAKRIYPSKY